MKITKCEIVNKTKYLGIEVSAKNIDLFKNNFKKLWRKLEKDMISWNKLRLSFLGRISVIKMSLFPKVMFLLHNIPIVKGKKIWEEWHRKIFRFIWAGEKTRIKRITLVDDTSRGGLKVPNLKLYLEAILLSWSKDWIEQKNIKLLNLEGFNLNYGWHAYMLHKKYKVDKMFNHHFIRKNILEVWRKYKLRIVEVHYRNDLFS